MPYYPVPPSLNPCDPCAIIEMETCMETIILPFEFANDDHRICEFENDNGNILKIHADPSGGYITLAGSSFPAGWYSETQTLKVSFLLGDNSYDSFTVNGTGDPFYCAWITFVKTITVGQA